MGTAPEVPAALLAALAEAIQPYCAAPSRADGGRRQGRRAAPAAPAGTGASAPPHVERAAAAAAPQAAAPAPRSAGPALPSLRPEQWRRIGRDVLALHEGYTRRRGAFAHDANPIHTRLPAYQLYFLPRNWYRVRRVIEALPWAHDAAAGVPPGWLSREQGQETLRLLDVGCGTGAFSLAWLAWLAERRQGAATPLVLHLTLVDQGHGMLDLALANLQAYARRALPGVTLRTELHADGVEAFLASRLPGGQPAIAGAAMTLNELGLLGPRRTSERAVALAAGLQARLRPGGCLLFVEPGTRKGYMNLMALREQLLHQPLLYPCPHGEACPMWGGAVRHWCHATVRLPAGFFFDAELRKRAAVRFEMRDLQLAALAVQTVPAAATRPDPGPPFRPRVGERIVSAPMPARGAGPGAGAGAGPGASAAAGAVVLCCAPDGRLHERPAPIGGPYTRGRWSPLPAVGPAA